MPTWLESPLVQLRFMWLSRSGAPALSVKLDAGAVPKLPPADADEQERDDPLGRDDPDGGGPAEPFAHKADVEKADQGGADAEDQQAEQAAAPLRRCHAGDPLPLRVAGAREDEVRRHVVELLSWVGLKDHLDARPPTLSGGQQQRVAIARAVIVRPKLLLADEPTGNIDDKMATRLMYLFEELNKLGTAIVIATHNENLVGRYDHSCLRLDSGRLEVQGAAQGPAPAVEAGLRRPAPGNAA